MGGDVTLEKKTRRPDIYATYDILKKIRVFSQKKMSKQGQNLLILFLTCLNFIRYTHSYYITVDARDEQCFFDKVKTGTKLGLIFEVVEGGALDIDVRIEGPDGKDIHSGERESNGKYTFAAHLDGVYKYCFSNQMSTTTPKHVMFTMEIGETPNPDEHIDHNKLEEMVKELSQSLTGAKHEQEYMEVRDRIHRAVNDNTNSRVVMWSFFEALVLVAMTVGQVYYLKRFFEVRRVV